jgi:PAS domain-containing protein
MTTEACAVICGCAVPCGPGAAVLPDVPDALIAVDVRASITCVNATACDWLGVGPEELIGRPVLDAIASPALCTLVLGALISSGRCEGRAAVRGQPEQRVLARAEPLADEAGNAVGGLLTLTTAPA